MSTTHLEKVGIISIGEMGLGIAQLLIARGRQVYSFAEDRSLNTQSRARDAGVQLCPTVEDLVSSSSVILSIVPPRDAYATAQRIHAATPSTPDARQTPLYYLDLNAVAPRTAVEIGKVLARNPNISFLDGGIIGGVPYPIQPEPEQNQKARWHCPSLIVSGPDRLPDKEFANLLNIDHLEAPIGAATGLKMCIACMTKGSYALAIQAFATAHELSVLDEFRAYLGRYFPATLKFAESGLVAMPHKAYRWVHEMMEIGETMATEGGFERNLFQSVAEVYRSVAEDTLLGMEQPGQRVRGQTVEDVVQLLSEGMRAKKLKSD